MHNYLKTKKIHIMNLFERLTPEAKQKIENLEEFFPSIYQMVTQDLKENQTYLNLKYHTIINLYTYNVVKGQDILEINKLFND